MDSITEKRMKDLCEESINFEADRRKFAYDNIINDEIRLSECIDDIIDLHRDFFLLPRTEGKPGDIRNEHTYASNKPKGSEESRFPFMHISEYKASESDYFYDESQIGDDENELAIKTFVDLVKDREIEISRLVKSLIDNFFHFQHQLEDFKGDIEKANVDVLRDLSYRVMQLDEHICSLHAKYAELLVTL